MTTSDERHREAGKAIRRQMALEKIEDHELASFSDLPVDQLIPLVSGLAGPWSRSAMVAVSVGLNWPADAVERLLQGEDPEDFSHHDVSPEVAELMTDEVARQAAVLMSYIGDDAQMEMLVTIRAIVDKHVPGA